MKLNMDELVPLIIEVIDSGATFRLYPHGVSMMPTINPGEDSVELAKPKELKKYDVVLYRRECGKYVLHRIVDVHGDLYDMCGDNQLEIEKGITGDSIIAFVVSIYKGDKQIESNDTEYLKQIKRLYRKKTVQRFIGTVKSFLYPAYKLIFKR